MMVVKSNKQQNATKEEDNLYIPEIIYYLTFPLLFALVDCSKDKKKLIAFKDILKFFGNSWEKQAELIEEFSFYDNITQYFYQWLVKISNQEISFFKLEAVHIDTKNALDEILENCVNGKSENFIEKEDIARYFSDIIRTQYFKLLQEKKFEPKTIRKPKFEIDYTLKVKNDTFCYHFHEMLFYTKNSSLLNFSFDRKKCLQFEQEMESIIKKNHILSKKEENTFCDYISNLKFINSAVKVPFEGLYKYSNLAVWLKYFEMQEKLLVESWLGEEDHWRVKILSSQLLPFIPNTSFELVKERKSKVLEDHLIVELQENSRTLIINGVKIAIRKSEYQFELLKVLLKEKPLDFDLDFSEIAEKIDFSYNDLPQEKQQKIKKRYDNALYQLNNKIALEVGVKDFLLKQKGLVRFNSKYQIKFS